MNSLESKFIIKGLAKKYNISKEEIETVVNSITHFMRDKMKENVDREKMFYPSFRVPNFGKFFVPDNVKINVLKSLNKQKENNANSQKNDISNESV